ncbi:MAG: tetratricopeptide repeat protein [Pseudomonadales bacterium]
MMNRVFPFGCFAVASTLCLFLAACGEGQSSGADIEDYIKVSQRYQEQGQFRAAIIEAQNAIQKAPGNPQSFKRLAQIYNELGAGKKASDIILKLPKLEDPDLVLSLHEAYLQQRKYKSASALLEQHSELQQTHPEQYFIAFAATQAALGKSNAAESSFQKALEISVGNSAALIGLAKLEAQRKNFDMAIALLDKITEDDENITASFALKSDIAYARGDLANAEESLNNALFTLKETDLPTPERVNVLQKLIEVLTQQGRSNEAYIYSKSLADANPLGHELSLKFQKAIEEYQNGKLEEAEALLIEIHEQSSGNAMSGQMLGMVNYLQGDVGEAESLLSKYVDTETASTEAKLMLASAQLGSNKPEDALKVLEEDANISGAKSEVLAMYGLATLQVGQIDEGVSFIHAALQKNPKNPALRIALAQYYASAKQIDKAEEELLIAFEISPEDAKVQAALIEALLLNKELNEAENVSAKIRKDYPKSSTSFSLAGHVAVAKDDLNAAKTFFSTAQKLDDKNLSSLYGLAKIEFKQKRWPQAEKYFKQIAQIDPQQVNAYRGILLTSAANNTHQSGIEYIKALSDKLLTPKLVLAEKYIEIGDYQAALTQIQNAQSINPDSKYAAELNARALLGYSQALMAVGNFVDAREATMSALQIAPQSLRLLQHLARIDIANQKTSEAEKTLERMSEIAPNEPLVHELRADLALAEGNTSNAINSYRLAWNTGILESSAGKLYQLLSKSEPEKAQEFLQEWQSKTPDSSVLLTLMAQQKENKGDINGAIKLYEKAINVAPNSPAVLNNLAWLYHTNGDERAIEYAEQAYTLAPNSAAVADTYGWILVKSGYKDKGIEVLTHAASIAPDIKEIEQHLKEAKAL